MLAKLGDIFREANKASVAILGSNGRLHSTSLLRAVLRMFSGSGIKADHVVHPTHHLVPLLAVKEKTSLNW